MSHIFIVQIILTNMLFFTISKNIEIIAGLIILLSVGVYLYIKNSLERKDILNIIKDNNRVYFNLSDDIYFYIDNFQNGIFDEKTISTIERRIESIKEDIYKIEFINFYDEKLYNRLNRLIGL